MIHTPCLQDLIQNPNPLTISGHWSVIQWIPNIITRECFNIGVTIQSSSGSIKYIKTIDQDNLGRFACMFGEEIIDHLQGVIKIAELAFESNLLDISDHINFDQRGAIKGQSGTALIEHLFDSTVPLGQPIVHKKRNHTGFSALNSQALNNHLIDSLKKQNQYEYENIVAQNTTISINNKSLYIPLRPKDKQIIGNWTSNVFSDVKRLKTEYLQTINDLRTASDTYKFEPALFALRPNQENLQHLSQSKIDTIYETLDKLDSSLKPQGIMLYAEDSIEELSNQISSWYKQAA